MSFWGFIYIERRLGLITQDCRQSSFSLQKVMFSVMYVCSKVGGLFIFYAIGQSQTRHLFESFVTGRNEVVAKVIFLHLSVIHSVHRGGVLSPGGVCVWSGGSGPVGGGCVCLSVCLVRGAGVVF